MKRSPLSLELKLIDVRILHQASERVLVSCLLLSLERICRASNWCVQFVIPFETHNSLTTRLDNATTFFWYLLSRFMEQLSLKYSS